MQSGKGNLELYERFWYRVKANGRKHALGRMRRIRESVGGDPYGRGDDPIGAHRAAAQNMMLGNLAEVAAGRIDDWMSLVDPTLNYDENRRILLNNGGEATERQIQDKRDRIVADGGEKVERHAIKTIRQNFEAIEAGEKSDLVSDLEAEFSPDFVECVLIDERAKYSTVEETVSDAKTPPSKVEERVNPVPKTRDYSGVVGFGRLLIDMVKIPFWAGYHGTKSESVNS